MIDGLDMLRERIRERMNHLADHVATGGCHTFEDYNRSVGKMEGFAEAEREILDLKKEVEES